MLDLEEMAEHEANQFLAGLVSDLSAERLYEISHEHYAMEMPHRGAGVEGSVDRADGLSQV